jgi:hypothetical protein
MRSTIKLTLVALLGLSASPAFAQDKGFAQMLDPDAPLGDGSSSSGDKAAPAAAAPVAPAAPGTPAPEATAPATTQKADDPGDGIPLPDLNAAKIGNGVAPKFDKKETNDNKGVTKYSDAILIDGGEGFRNRTKEALDNLSKTKVGKAVLDKLNALGADKPTTIVYYPQDAAQATNDDAYGKNPNEKGGRVDVTPNKGSGAKVFYDPYHTPTDAAQNPCPSGGPEVALGHELIHAVHDAQGTNRAAVPYTAIESGTENHEEAATIGLGAYAKDPMTENALRRELGVPLRTSHKGECTIVQPGH